MKFLTVRQVAQMLEVSVQAVYRLIDRGTLASAVIGSYKVVREDSVRTLMGDEAFQKRSRRGARCRN